MIELGDARVVVFRRELKNVHLTVHPPDGRVQITASQRHSLDALGRSRSDGCRGFASSSRRCGRSHAVLARWYRDQLRERVAKLLEVWAPRVGEWPAQVHVQRMKTKWGSCHPGRRAIRLNTELAKKPPECLEYVLVHELVHLREANHGPRFQAILDEVMPMWREHRDALNDAPLAHVDWEY